MTKFGRNSRQWWIALLLWVLCPPAVCTATIRAGCRLYLGALAPLPAQHRLAKLSRVATGLSPFGGDLAPEYVSWSEMVRDMFHQGVVPARLILGIHDRHGPYAYSFLPHGEPVLYVADPAMIDQILLHTSRRPPAESEKKAPKAVDLRLRIDRDDLQFGGARKWFGRDGIFTGTGPGWKEQRETMQAFFKPSAFASAGNYAIMTDIVDRHIEELRRRVGAGKVVDLRAEAENAILDIVLSSLFHTRVDPREIDQSLRPGLNEVMQWMVWDTALNPTGIDLMKWPSLTPQHARVKQAHRRLFALAERIVTEHEREPRQDMVGALLANPKFTRDDVRKQVALIIAVSLETSSSYASWALDSIARDPAIRHRLSGELAEKIGERPITGKDQTPYLDGVLNETLRYYAPFYFTMRRVHEPLTVVRDDGAKLVIPAGARVALSVQASQRREDAWGLARTGYPADRFEPARWTQPDHPEREADENDLCAFGAGSHTCLGMQFSKTEVRLLVSRLVQAFDLRATTAEPPAMGSRVATFPIGGVPTRLVPRTDKKESR